MKARIISLLAICVFLATGCDNKQSIVNPPVDPETEGSIPVLPDDPQESSTSFRHRIMLLQHTGTYCPNCPRLMTSLKELSEDKAYNDLYHHVASHSYNENGDAAYSEAASKLSQAFCSGFYPDLTFNLTKESIGTTTEADAIRAKIDALHKDSAVAGIAAATRLEDNSILVNAEIKSAAEGIYRIAVWLLEDNIESEQEGATDEWQHIHSNAVRAMAGGTLNLRIYGNKLPPLGPGEKAGQFFKIDLEDDWNTANCKVFILVNAADKDGKYDLVNCAVCPVNGSIVYDYN